MESGSSLETAGMLKKWCLYIFYWQIPFWLYPIDYDNIFCYWGMLSQKEITFVCNQGLTVGTCTEIYIIIVATTEFVTLGDFSVSLELISFIPQRLSLSSYTFCHIIISFPRAVNHKCQWHFDVPLDKTWTYISFRTVVCIWLSHMNELDEVQSATSSHISERGDAEKDVVCVCLYVCVSFCHVYSASSCC